MTTNGKLVRKGREIYRRCCL